ncbi:hypothetical protein AZE42_11339, partial [Rhizopogon vesiculosus]
VFPRRQINWCGPSGQSVVFSPDPGFHCQFRRPIFKGTLARCERPPSSPHTRTLQVMAGQPNDDIERAGPSMDSQRDEQLREKDSNTATTAAVESALVDVWTKKLQMLTLVTTFLASIDGKFFSLTSNAPSAITTNSSEKSQEFVYSCFTGALVFHVCASLLGYAASFALIRYEYVNAEVSSIRQSNELPDPSSPSSIKFGKPQLRHRPIVPFYAVNTVRQEPSVTVRAHSRTFSPPLALLSRCYHTTLVLGGVGFAAAVLGITTYAWEELQQIVGIFTTACLGVCLLAGVWAMV